MVRYWKHRSSIIQKVIEPHIEKYFPYHKPEMDRVSPHHALLSGRIVQPPFDLAIGQVIPSSEKPKTNLDIIKVKLHKLCLNRFLLKYYYQTASYWVHSNKIKTNVGDIVLVEKCDVPIAFHTIYKLKKVEFPIGNIIDPVTNIRSYGREYNIDMLKTLLKQQI